MSEMKLFTLEEAEATLPLVRRIVADVQLEYPIWRTAIQRYEIEASGVRAEWGEPAELVRMRDEATASAERISHYLGELEAVGCVLKGFESGTVDFYSLRDDRVVFLCWDPGEDRIAHWHETNAGYPGRQPLDASLTSGARA